MSEERTPRSVEDRTAAKRTSDSWVPPSNLPMPDDRPGYVHRWVRTSTLNNVDNANISRKLREGWEPVQASEYEEIQVRVDHNSAFKGCIELGGLLLCRMPVEKYRQRQAYYDRMAQNQLQAVDNDMFREEVSQMPFLKPERDTRTTFGRGGS